MLTAYRTEPQRWNAVTQRDAAADGCFVFGVRTTGVYCRPACRSRQPRRENVIFFQTPFAAERAGFRACKRCRPTDTAGLEPHRAAILAACRTIDRAEQPISLAELAEPAGLSPFHFQRVFKRIVGVSPKQYALGIRTNRLKLGLQTTESVTRAVQLAGFDSSSRAYEGVSRRIGMRPGAFLRGGAGVRIRSIVFETALGWTLLAASDKGVCWIEFGESRGALQRRPSELFPNAEHANDARGLTPLARTLADLISNKPSTAELPLDIHGTVFQQRVWQALRQIPRGEAVSYRELAARLRVPRAVRAVANACGQNRLAVAIPCHRVIGTDGNLHGYRWGVERKRKLLALERAASS